MIRILLIIIMYVYVGIISVNWVHSRDHYCIDDTPTTAIYLVIGWPAWLQDEMSHNDLDYSSHECVRG